MKNKVGDIWIEPWNETAYRLYVVVELGRSRVSLARLAELESPPTPGDIAALDMEKAGEPKSYWRMNYAGIPHASYREGNRIRTILPWRLWYENEMSTKKGVQA